MAASNPPGGRSCDIDAYMDAGGSGRAEKPRRQLNKAAGFLWSCLLAHYERRLEFLLVWRSSEPTRRRLQAKGSASSGPLSSSRQVEVENWTADRATR